MLLFAQQSCNEDFEIIGNEDIIIRRRCYRGPLTKVPYKIAEELADKGTFVKWKEEETEINSQP